MDYWTKPEKRKKYEVYIISDRCKGCDFCIEFCPKDVFEEGEELNKKGYKPPIPKNIDDCIGCRFCELICPEFAINVKERKNSENSKE